MAAIRIVFAAVLALNATAAVTASQTRLIWPGDGMELETVGGKFPGQHVKAKNGVLDISEAPELVTTLSNKTDKPVQVLLYVHNGSPQGLTPTGSVTLPPCGTGVIVCDLNPEPWVLDKPLELVGMSGRPKAKVAFCHIPLFAAPDHPDHPHDGTRIDPDDYAYWSRECAELWGPILEDAGVRLVVCGHKHRFRYDPPTADRPWAQVLGGGPALGTLRGRPDDSLFPTVVEGWTEGDALRLSVHDVHRGRVVLDETFPPA